MRERGGPPYSVLGTALFVATTVVMAMLVAWHRPVAAALVFAVAFALTLPLRRLGLLYRWTYGREGDDQPARRNATAMTPEQVRRRRLVTIAVLVAVLLPLPFLVFGGR